MVDPGQGESDPARHLPALLAAAAGIELIVLTHRHHDHAELAPALHAATGVPVRAADPALCLGGDPLADGEVLAAGGVEVQVLATPGHTSDSVCLRARRGVRCSPATPMLGRGTTVVAHPDGALGAVPRLAGDGCAISATGWCCPVTARSCRRWPRSPSSTSRTAATGSTRCAPRLATLGADASARQIVEHVYADVDRSVWWAAELSVQAQLDYLRTLDGASERAGGPAARGRGSRRSCPPGAASRARRSRPAPC